MRLSITLLLAGCLGAACSGDAELPSNESSTSASQVGPIQSSDAMSLKLLGALVLENGNTVEFFDTVNGMLVAETGPATTAPRIRQQDVERRDFVRLWQTLAPRKPAPSALVAMQERLGPTPGPAMSTNTPNATGASNVLFGTTPLTPKGKNEVSPTVATGCNNRCCDPDYLSSVDLCTGGQWFLFNSGYSWASASHVFGFAGFVCSAQGTSTYRFNTRGHTNYSGIWSVPEGYYKSFWWAADWTLFWPCWGFCPEDASSYVNSANAMHLHTYCGYVNH
jgi:hypothetical protein